MFAGIASPKLWFSVRSGQRTFPTPCFSCFLMHSYYECRRKQSPFVPKLGSGACGRRANSLCCTWHAGRISRREVESCEVVGARSPRPHVLCMSWGLGWRTLAMGRRSLRALLPRVLSAYYERCSLTWVSRMRPIIVRTISAGGTQRICSFQAGEWLMSLGPSRCFCVRRCTALANLGCRRVAFAGVLKVPRSATLRNRPRRPGSR